MYNCLHTNFRSSYSGADRKVTAIAMDKSEIHRAKEALGMWVALISMRKSKEVAQQVTILWHSSTRCSGSAGKSLCCITKKSDLSLTKEALNTSVEGVKTFIRSGLVNEPAYMYSIMAHTFYDLLFALVGMLH